MATRPRLSPGSVDLGDVRQGVENVTEENVELYDRTYQTIIENFTDPLSAEDQRRIVENLTQQAIAELAVQAPESARRLLQVARQGMEG